MVLGVGWFPSSSTVRLVGGSGSLCYRHVVSQCCHSVARSIHFCAGTTFGQTTTHQPTRRRVLCSVPVTTSLGLVRLVGCLAFLPHTPLASASHRPQSYAGWLLPSYCGTGHFSPGSWSSDPSGVRLGSTSVL